MVFKYDFTFKLVGLLTLKSYPLFFKLNNKEETGKMLKGETHFSSLKLILFFVFLSSWDNKLTLSQRLKIIGFIKSDFLNLSLMLISLKQT